MTITTQTQAPTFANSTQAAAWVEGFLKGILKRDPRELHLDSRRTVTEFKQDALHVTELIGECLRKPILRLMGVQPDYDPEDDQVWAHVGLLYEEWVRAAFRMEFPGRLKSNQPVPGLPIVVASESAEGPLEMVAVEGGRDLLHTQGYYDLWWKDAGLLIDVKSRSRAEIVEMKTIDEAQVAVYASHMSEANGGMTVHGVLVYTYRENLADLDCYPCTFDKADIIQRTDGIAKAIANQVQLKQPYAIRTDFAPDRAPCTFHMSATRENRCAFFSYCWEKAEVKLPGMSTPMIEELLTEHRAVTEQKKELETQAEALHLRKKELEGLLRPAMEENNNWIAVSTWTDVDAKGYAATSAPTYDLKTAFAKNPEWLEKMKEYQRPGTPYYYIRTVKKKAVK